jgi:4-amino-4-deoxy-L-arabinose transferase-like glycosyltransferase
VTQARRRHELAAVGLATLVGLLLRLALLDQQDFLKDEYFTYGFVSAPLSRLLSPAIAVETNPPTYYLLQKAWLALGSSRIAMRSLPALLGALAIPLVYLIGRRLGGRGVGFVAALLFATAPVHIRFARQIRCYSGLTLLACAALTCLLYLLPPPEAPAGEPQPARRSPLLWWGYGLALALAAVFHNTGILLVAVAMLLVACEALVFRSLAPAAARRLLVVTALTLLPFLLWLPILERQALGDLGSAVAWIPPMSLDAVSSQMLGAYAVPRLAKPVVYGFALWTAWSLLRTRPRVAAPLLVVLVGQPVLLAVASLVRPMFLVRALLWPTALFPVLLALGIGRLGSARRQALAVAALVAVQLVSARESYTLQRETAAADLAAAHVAAEAGAGDAVFLVPSPAAWEWDYAVRDSPLRELPRYAAFYGDAPEPLRSWTPAEVVERGRLPDIARRTPGAVWLVAESRPLLPIPRDDGLEPTLEALRAQGFTLSATDLGPVVVTRIQARPGS